MNRQEFDSIMDAIGRSQNRALDTRDLSLWDSAVGHHPYGVVSEALGRYLRSCTDYLTPALLNRYITEVATDRLSRAGAPDVPSGLDTEQYQRCIRAFTNAVLDGIDASQAQREALEACGAPTPVPGPRRAAPIPTLRTVSTQVVPGEVVTHLGDSSSS